MDSIKTRARRKIQIITIQTANRSMGTTFSIKHRAYGKKNSSRGKRHTSCDVVGGIGSLELVTSRRGIPGSQSFNQIYSPTHAKRHHSKLFSISSHDSSGSTSSCDVTEKDFVQKVQRYLHSIEQLGEISDIKCHFGNLTLRTEEETLSVEVVEEGVGAGGEPIVTLESEPTQSNTFMIYQYSAQALNSRYTYFSMLYIKDVDRSDSRYYVLQAGVNNGSGVPGFIPRRIKSSDNPKLVSHSSRFVGTFEKDGPKSTLIVFLTKEMQPCYLAQSELSLDFTTDQFRAGIFDFKEKSLNN